MSWFTEETEASERDAFSRKIEIQEKGVDCLTSGERMKRASVCLPLKGKMTGAGGRPAYFNVRPDERGVPEEEIPGFSLIEPAALFGRALASGRKVGDILSQEFNGVVAANLWGCEAKSQDRGCAFCAALPYGGPKFSVGEWAEGCAALFSELPDAQLAVNAGSLLTPSMGYERMRPYVRAARDAEAKVIQVEIAPPESASTFSEMAADGVTSVQLNLEAYDEPTRRRLMPWKGTIPVERYLSAIGEARERFGKGKATSVLLLGLEPYASLIKGIDAVLEAGGIPSVENLIPRAALLAPPVGYMIGMKRRAVSYAKRRIGETYGNGIWGSLEGCGRCGGCPLYADSAAPMKTIKGGEPEG